MMYDTGAALYCKITPSVATFAKISITTISRIYILGHVVSFYQIWTCLWNRRDIEPPIDGTQYFTILCMLRISTPDLTFHEYELPNVSSGYCKQMIL